MRKIITLKECLKLNASDEKYADILIDNINVLLKKTNWEVTQSINVETFNYNERIIRYVYEEIVKAGWTCNIYDADEFEKSRVMTIFRRYPDLDELDY